MLACHTGPNPTLEHPEDIDAEKFLRSGVMTDAAPMTEERQNAGSVSEPISIVDIADFEAVYRAWAPPMYAYCYRRLRNVENAEDATSQVFQQAFRGRAGFHGGSVPAWLFRIAERVIADHYRAARSASSIDFAAEIVDRSPGPDTQVIQIDETARLQRAIADLPEHRRRVIELRLAGLTSPDIAQLLDRSPEWVRTNQRRAVLQLQEVLHVTPDKGGSSDG
jgi:RNA polymerase sigma factor (sigma-70 family)